ncbi:MAG: endo alpha-1,4 polygalactosaminidase [Clostridia bacterium]|nr:endo alpha-1,4 polygalactosaminidase [Clostridia bacterium]
MVKKLLVLVMAAILCSTLFAGCEGSTVVVSESIFSRDTVERVPGEKKEWLDVDNFVCYYGAYNEKMNDYDVAICESRNLGEEGIRKLNEAGVWTICYVTVGEDDSLNVADGLGEGGYASYYFYENGAPLMNGNWNSYFVDAGNPVWQKKIIKRAGEILDMGADGLFLDTLDTVDVSGYGSATIGGMVELVKLLRETYPDAKIVANRGFTVLDYISKYIDGMMFESFNTTWNFETGMADDLSESANNYNIATAVNTINKQRQYYYWPVFALDYINAFQLDYMAQHYCDRSWKYDFIPYLQQYIYLDDITTVPVRPQSKRGELAMVGEGEIAQSEGKPNGDTSEANMAYGTECTVTVDSYYSIDYRNNGTAAINDGFISETMYWAKRAWASADEGNPVEYSQDHWIGFEWGSPRTVNNVVIHWAFDNGVYYSSSQVVVQAFINGEWVDVADSREISSGSRSTEIGFDAVTTNKLRILQPAGMGPSFRKGIMWVSEVQLYNK